MASVTEPNLYELQGGNLRVTYSTTSITGKPIFSFQQGRKTLSFTGNDIQTVKTSIGTLVTVTIEAVADLKTVTFSLLLPAVNLQQKKKVNIKTIGILTTSKTSIGGPKLVAGALQTYKVVALRGSASAVLF